MKISFTPIKYIMAGTLLVGTFGNIAQANAQITKDKEFDTFIKTTPTPEGISVDELAKEAPSAKIKVNGENKFAKFVVDLSENVLYTYNNGNAEKAYLIASGKQSTPTTPGVRIVSHTETFPYRTAPRHTKRRRNPRAYGPKAIILDILDIKTGERSRTGEFIHGNNDSTSIGKYASKGCMRMNNEVIKELAKSTKRGDIVIILPNKNL